MGDCAAVFRQRDSSNVHGQRKTVRRHCRRRREGSEVRLRRRLRGLRATGEAQVTLHCTGVLTPVSPASLAVRRWSFAFSHVSKTTKRGAPARIFVAPYLLVLW